MRNPSSSEIVLPSSFARRCTDRSREKRASMSIIAASSTAQVDAAIAEVERTALSALAAAGYGEEDIADVKLSLECLREEMASIFSRR